MFKLAFILILSSLFINDCKPCSCQTNLDFSISEYDIYDKIFNGKCIEIIADSNKKINTYTFELLEAFKGKMNKKVKINAFNEPSMCGFNFIVGNRYLIFSNKGMTTSCNGNIPYDSDSLNLWGNSQKISVYIKDSFCYLNGNEIMLFYNKAKSNKINTLRNLKKVKNGIVYSYFTDGTMNSVIHLKNGKKHGKVVYCFQNHTLKFYGTYKKDKKHGYCEEYKYMYNHSLSKYQYIKECGYYKNNKKVGIWNHEILGLSNYFFL